MVDIVNKHQYFISQELLKDLDDASLKMEAKIPRQFKDRTVQAQLTQVSSGVSTAYKVTFIVTVGLNVLASGLLNQFFGSMRHLQLVTHALMLKVIVPANVLLLIQYLLPITQFDFLEPWWNNKLIGLFDIDEDKYEVLEINGSEVSDQFKTVGYDNTLVILLLGSVGFYFALHFLKIVILICCYIVLKTTGRGEKIFKKLYIMVFFDDLLKLSKESYIDLLVASYFVSKFPVGNEPTAAESLSVGLGILSKVICFILVPCVLVYGSIYQTRMDQPLVPDYGRGKTTSAVKYFIRRILLVQTIFIPKVLQGLQLHFMITFNTASFIYVGG
jgi:hypothetical protein